ncbi:MAG: hypothetical protein U0L47_05340 [Paludibacteraceae bacterium]|nr:hypothetical protein [Paludibacteraceae bacterium]
MKKIYTILVCVWLLAGFVACEKDKDFALTTLTVQNETITPSYGSATIDCSFKSDATISEAFVQYSLLSSFAKYDVAKMTEEKGKYAAQLTGLADNTTYYIRYTVSNKYSSVVTEEVIEFQTLQCTVPTIVLDSIADVWENRAKAYIHLAFDGGASVTDMGICWGTQANPTIEDIHKSTKDTVAVLDIPSLQPNTQYYVRAYAVNKVGVAYSEEKTFTTSKEIALPTVTTAIVTQITETSAVASGNVTSDGGAEVTERGVCIATVSNPTTAHIKISAGGGKGSFTCNLTGLQPNTTYYVRAYATNEVGTAYGEKVIFTTKEESSIPSNGTENGHEYVDLGLSVKWATCNVGASKPEDYGDYFAWGETTTKSTYNWSTYKYCNGSYNSLTKYNTRSDYGTVDNKTQLDLSDDAARANWGGAWRMPTDAELTELREQCTWSWTTQNGVNGYKVTSKSNGNSIFLPAAGCRYGGSFLDAGNYGYYWSSLLSTDYPRNAYELNFSSSNVSRNGYGRDYGLSVRPVLGENKIAETTAPTITTNSVTQITETSAVAGGNVTSDGGASVTERGVVYSTNPNPVITNLNNTIRPCDSGTGVFTYTMTGLQPNTTYYVRAYATNEVGTAYGEEVSFTTQEQSSTPNNGTENGYAYVDLGLSVKWATMNVGASSPEDYGDYFAWGETEPKEVYDWSTYKYGNGSYLLTKYNNNSNYGTVDNKTQLDLTDDAAYVNWGGAWRMPTDAELTELGNNCTWTWTSQNGVNGYNVTSKSNGNSIFLPAAGYRYDTSLRYAGSDGYYWSGSLRTGSPHDAWLVNFDAGSVYWKYLNRVDGFTVRPVCP